MEIALYIFVGLLFSATTATAATLYWRQYYDRKFMRAFREWEEYKDHPKFNPKFRGPR